MRLSTSEETPSWTLMTSASRTHFLWVPAALLFGYGLTFVPLFRLLTWYFVSIPIHEMGHAIMAWIGGRIAIPIGAIIPMAAFTWVMEGRSIWVGMLVIFGLLFFVRQGWRSRNATLFLLSILWAVISFRMTFLTSDQEWERLVAWGGVGGEFILSGLLVMLYFYDFPSRWGWDFFRYPVLVYGAIGFASAMAQWHGIRTNQQGLPQGSFLGGSDSMGDMEVLMQIHGWSMSRIIESYWGVGLLMSFFIAVHWIGAMLRGPEKLESA